MGRMKIPRTSFVSGEIDRCFPLLIIITDSEVDIDNLITKTEKEGDEDATHKEGNAFSFAKVWTADKDELDEIVDDDQFAIDSWAQTLQKINEEMAIKQAQEEEESGKGGRRHARRKTATVVNVRAFVYAFFTFLTKIPVCTWFRLTGKESPPEGVGKIGKIRRIRLWFSIQWLWPAFRSV